jgi:hypothetical protein
MQPARVHAQPIANVEGLSRLTERVKCQFCFASFWPYFLPIGGNQIHDQLCVGLSGRYSLMDLCEKLPRGLAKPPLQP